MQFRDLGRAERISSDFNNEKILIRQKLDNAGYPSPFMNSVIKDHEHKRSKRQDQEDECITPTNLLELRKNQYW